MRSSRPPTRPARTALKIVVGGGFGVGKTTFVGAISEIEPLTTEGWMTSAGAPIDDRAFLRDKTSTTVAMDFGRITLEDQLVLYLFGTPGQDRFGFMWDQISDGALGAVVLVDTRRIETSFPAVDYFEHRDIPFVVGINRFEGSMRYAVPEVREALTLRPEVTLVELDARARESVKSTLVVLVEDLIRQIRAGHLDGVDDVGA